MRGHSSANVAAVFPPSWDASSTIRSHPGDTASSRPGSDTLSWSQMMQTVPSGHRHPPSASTPQTRPSGYRAWNRSRPWPCSTPTSHTRAGRAEVRRDPQVRAEVAVVNLVGGEPHRGGPGSMTARPSAIPSPAHVVRLAGQQEHPRRRGVRVVLQPHHVQAARLAIASICLDGVPPVVPRVRVVREPGGAGGQDQHAAGRQHPHHPGDGGPPRLRVLEHLRGYHHIGRAVAEQLGELLRRAHQVHTRPGLRVGGQVRRRAQRLVDGADGPVVVVRAGLDDPAALDLLAVSAPGTQFMTLACMRLLS